MHPQQPPEPLEQLEKLEQLRVLAVGRPIRVGVVRQAGIGVDTMADYEEFVRAYRENRPFAAACQIASARPKRIA